MLNDDFVKQYASNSPDTPVKIVECKHLNQSPHPYTSDIRLCCDCDARSVDGGITWMPFEEYKAKHCIIRPASEDPAIDEGSNE